jgi:hypothetical protein
MDFAWLMSYQRAANLTLALYRSRPILSPLPEILAFYQDDSTWHFVIHADNVRLHCLKTVTLFLDHNSLRWTPHSSYSPHLIFSDFWFFGYLKGVLQWNSFDESDDLLLATQEILRESILRLWMPYFKNGWSDCKYILMEMVDMLSDV